MRWLMLGDITGHPGVTAVVRYLPDLVTKHRPDLVIANAENSAQNGRGITRQAAERLYDAGVEILTLGNHAFDQKDTASWLGDDPRIIRPANLHTSVPGQGYTIVKVNGGTVAVLNLIGPAGIPLGSNPFLFFDQFYKDHSASFDLLFVDFHAEFTSEKLAFGWYADGRATAVIGTHTHVQTADERILPNGTGYLTDVGMTGPRDGVLGVRKETVIRKFIDQLPARFDVADGYLQLSGVLIDIADNGRVTKIERIQQLEG
ncbi:TIGR00282 family metallophosphoesterase [Ferroacidibacillus organovorans]|uniref:Metallophosphoesterase n=1 Tax=Ferroacidibacillus organovorans TaxID=1765683 RepID=A0A124IWC9_9BACL|nr:TIGR00282 family metallophosphoesterase [Ferroacidibacillus organovorans]KUO97010.1 metallophosphoesterase [Ferroacidibacillus organovorans]